MARIKSYIGQVIAYAVFMALIGYFSTSPAWIHLPPDTAVIKLSFAHYGQVVGDCRERSEEELARMPPNMRTPMECPRERSPIVVELDMGGEPVFRGELRPSGLSRDGMAYAYETFTVPAGTHTFNMRMRDDVRTAGFDYTKTAEVHLDPGDLLVIDFSGEQHKFILSR